MHAVKPVRLLFVCMGNICRSPTAEGVMRALLREQGLEDVVEVDSAGTGAWHVGDRPTRATPPAGAGRPAGHVADRPTRAPPPLRAAAASRSRAPPAPSPERTSRTMT